MRKQERLDSLPDLLITALKGAQSEMWTSLPGIIQSFNPVAKTCVVQPSLKVRIKNVQYGTPGFTGSQYDYVQLPLLTDCPVHFPSGGGYTLTFPVATGDECLIVFSTRCIDNWWSLGGIQNATNVRMHDLSDGFVFVGVNSAPTVVPAISTNSAQLRSNDGNTFVELKNGTINITSPTAIILTAPTVTVNSTTATINASGTATISSPSIILKNAGTALKKLVNDTFITFFNAHVHSNGNGGANTGAPTVPAGTTTTTSTVQAE